MAGPSSDLKLQQLMHKLAGIEPLTPADVRAIDDQVSRRPRRPSRRPLPVPDQELQVTEWSQIGQVYKKGITGLTERGWMEFGDTKYLGMGLYGRVTLGMAIRDRDKEPQQRLLCAIKVQSIDKKDEAWKEVAVMRSLVHEHIIDYYDHFVVDANEGTTIAEAQQEVKMFKMDRSPGYKSPPRQESPDQGTPPPRSRSHGLSPSVVLAYRRKTLWLIMEFADAGNLMDEMERFPNDLIPESGILFYAKQIISGLEYMHGKAICHCDLHLGNILLKFLMNGAKKCLITDFGRARIHCQEKYWYNTDWYEFTKNFTVLICGTPNEMRCNHQYLTKIGRSPAACAFTDLSFSRDRCPKSADQMWSLPWIASGRAVPPVPTLAARLKSPVITAGPSDEVTSHQTRTRGHRQLDPVPEATSDEERDDGLRHAANAAVEADLRDSRPGLGSRIRRSISSFSHNVADRVRGCGTCFRPHAD